MLIELTTEMTKHGLGLYDSTHDFISRECCKFTDKVCQQWIETENGFILCFTEVYDCSLLSTMNLKRLK